MSSKRGVGWVRVTAMARLGVAALPIALAGACGGETEGGGSRLSTGLPPDLVLNEASASEQAQFCAALAEFTLGAGDAPCVVVGLALSSDAEECRAQEEQCRQEMQTSAGRDEVYADCESEVAQPSCVARVADAERCYSASLVALKRVVGRVSCSSSEEEIGLAFDDAEAGLSACNTLQERCPSLYEGDSGGGSDDCCDPSDPCDWASDGACDCEGTTAWDVNDCGASQPCCGASDTCNWANDGECDCEGTTAWDVNDCSTPAGGACCAPDDPCLFANDAWCDCPEQAWDAADCRG